MNVSADSITVSMTKDEWQCVMVALSREVETSELFCKGLHRGATTLQIRHRLAEHERVCYDLNNKLSKVMGE